LKNSEP